MSASPQTRPGPRAGPDHQLCGGWGPPLTQDSVGSRQQMQLSFWRTDWNVGPNSLTRVNEDRAPEAGSPCGGWLTPSEPALPPWNGASPPSCRRPPAPHSSPSSSSPPGTAPRSPSCPPPRSASGGCVPLLHTALGSSLPGKHRQVQVSAALSSIRENFHQYTPAISMNFLSSSSSELCLSSSSS